MVDTQAPLWGAGQMRAALAPVAKLCAIPTLRQELPAVKRFVFARWKVACRDSKQPSRTRGSNLSFYEPSFFSPSVL